jgi:hypothetical protein
MISPAGGVPAERGVEVLFDAVKVTPEREHPALETQDLGEEKTFLPPRPFDLHNRFVEQLQGTFDVAGQCQGFGQKRLCDGNPPFAAGRFPSCVAGPEKWNCFCRFACQEGCCIWLDNTAAFADPAGSRCAAAGSKAAISAPWPGRAILAFNPAAGFSCIGEYVTRQPHDFVRNPIAVRVAGKSNHCPPD